MKETKTKAKNGNEIEGGDSYTITVADLVGLKTIKEEEQDEAKKEVIETYNSAIETITNKLTSELKKEEKYSDNEINNGISAVKREIISPLQREYEESRKRHVNEENAHEIAMQNAINTTSSNIEQYAERLKNDSVSEMYAVLKNNYYNELFESFKIAYERGIEVKELEIAINSLNKDIMGEMRSLAGSTLRLVYAIIWLMLIFQLIGLTILYFKRVFMIAILIAIFPLVMLTYCIDKMADGSAQTFSMWMKEFLSNIFIQTVHAIIYAVLIDMGLQLYEGGTQNWIFLVGAMFLLLPAESIMKEIFDLNGSTLSQVSGTFTKLAFGAGALVSLAKAGKSEKDASIKSANERRMKRLQNSQNRADSKARARQFRSTYQLDQSRYGGIKGKATLAADRFKGWDNVKYVARPNGKPNVVREKIYHGATAARKAYAKAAPRAGRVIRGVRNVTAVTVGALYAASGGDAQSIAQGAAVAQGLSGKTKNLKKKPDLKTELSAAYKRKK